MPGLLTQAQLITEVQAGLGNRNDLNLTTTRLVNGLNIGQQIISRYYDFTDTNQTIFFSLSYTGVEATDKTQTLPTGIKSIHSWIIQDQANSQKMREKPWRQFDQQVPLPEYIAPGWPYYYTRFGYTTAQLFPVPQQAFATMARVTMLPTPFTVNGTTQTSDFIDKDDIIISLSVAYFFRLMGRPDLAKQHLDYAHDRLVEAKANVEDRPDMDISADDMGGGINSGAYWSNAFVRYVDDV